MAVSSLIHSLLLVFTGLSAGYLLQRIRPADYRRVRQRIQVFSLVFLSPFTIISTVWIAPWRHWEMFSLPLIGVTALMLGSFSALFLGRRMGMSREQQGVYFVCGGFSNLGSLGGLISYMLLGEGGYALVPFYSLFERFWYFLAGFPMAKSVSPTCAGTGKRLSVKQILLDPFVSVTLASTLAGMALNLTLPRPPVLGRINGVLIPVSSFVLMVSIGLAMKFGPMRSHLKAGLVMGGIKGLLLPLYGLTVGLLFGLGHVAEGLPLRLVLIECAMPVGFTALVPPTMYDLDLDLANTCWFLTTMGLVFVVPLLGLILPLL